MQNAQKVEGESVKYEGGHQEDGPNIPKGEESDESALDDGASYCFNEPRSAEQIAISNLGEEEEEVPDKEVNSVCI